MPTANEILLDAGIRQATYAQRYGSGLSKRILALMNETEGDLKDQITARLAKITERGYDMGPVTTKRLEDLLKFITAQRTGVFETALESLTGELQDFAEHEVDTQVLGLQKAIPVALDIETATPAPGLVRSIVTARPMQGRLLKEWAGDLEAAERTAFRSAIRLGMVEGEPIASIVKRLQGRLDLTKAQTEAVVRTAVNHVATHARQTVAEENQELVKGVQWISTLDGKTSAICRARDKEVYPVNSGPRPPGHFNCRSSIIYVLKSWEELGFTGKKEPKVGVRASMNGAVAGDLNYNDWLRSQANTPEGRKFIQDTLGKTKAKLFLDGGLTMDRFVDRQGGELTLAQLKERNAAAWNKAVGEAA